MGASPNHPVTSSLADPTSERDPQFGAGSRLGTEGGGGGAGRDGVALGEEALLDGGAGLRLLHALHREPHDVRPGLRHREQGTSGVP